MVMADVQPTLIHAYNNVCVIDFVYQTGSATYHGGMLA